MENFTSVTAAGFVLLTITCYIWLLVLVHQALQKTDTGKRSRGAIFTALIVGLAVWAVVSGVLAYSGFLSDFSHFPPRLTIILIVPLVAVILLTTRPLTSLVLKNIQAQHLLYMQSFRIVVEILLWMLFLENLLPEQMTFEGRNWDILAGLTGPVMGYLFYKGKLSPLAIRIWNLACLALLINIVTIAILSAPLPFRVFMNEPANTIVTTFPYVWLPALLVPLAYLLHILSWKQMAIHGKKMMSRAR